MPVSTRQGRPTFDVGSENSRKAFWCFVLLCLSMFVNLILAFLRARGLPVSAGTVMAVQALLTALAVPAFLSPRVRFRGSALFALSFIAFSALVMNFLNPFNIKTMYDSLLIPIYIALGMSAAYLRPKWMNYLLLFVLLIVLMEIFLPSMYLSLFDPAGYFSGTREWVAKQKLNEAAADGFYVGAYRWDQSVFSFADHRIGGAFLEPLSLGYFAFLMSTYYAGLYRGPWMVRAAGIAVCVCIALSSDSRVPTMLILLGTLLLTIRWRPPVIVLWLAFPLVITTIFYAYLAQFEFLYGDTFGRLSITFDALKTVNIGQILVGMVPLERAGDSGILYMLRCVGLFGVPIAIWLYSGAYTRQTGTDVAFFVMIAVYLSVTLMFGGASLSIKTGSLLGYLVGLASLRRGEAAPRTRPNALSDLDDRGGVQDDAAALASSSPPT
jgi:hypothetical protein